MWASLKPTFLNNSFESKSTWEKVFKESPGSWGTICRWRKGGCRRPEGRIQREKCFSSHLGRCDNATGGADLPYKIGPTIAQNVGKKWGREGKGDQWGLPGFVSSPTFRRLGGLSHWGDLEGGQEEVQWGSLSCWSHRWRNVSRVKPERGSRAAPRGETRPRKQADAAQRTLGSSCSFSISLGRYWENHHSAVYQLPSQADTRILAPEWCQAGWPTAVYEERLFCCFINIDIYRKKQELTFIICISIIANY